MPAAAPPAAQSRLRMGFIWCGWIIEFLTSSSVFADDDRKYLPEIPVQNPAVNLRQLLEISDRRALVDLVHGLADQAELDHGAVVGDEAGIRGAAARTQFRFAAGDLLDG